MAFHIVPATAELLPQWAELRYALWAWDSVEDHAREAEKMYLSGRSDRPDRVAFLALDEDGKVAGFAEADLRRDYVEGCKTSPVAYLEGIYVRPGARKAGAAKALSDAVADWGRAKGCTEYASDALIDNLESHAFHAAIGFAETGRVVYFRKDL